MRFPTMLCFILATNACVVDTPIEDENSLAAGPQTPVRQLPPCGRFSAEIVRGEITPFYQQPPGSPFAVSLNYTIAELRKTVSFDVNVKAILEPVRGKCVNATAPIFVRDSVISMWFPGGPGHRKRHPLSAPSSAI